MTAHAPHTLASWYLRYRKDNKPKTALWHARLSLQAETSNHAALSALSPATRRRVDSFVDCFIRSEAVEYLTSENDSDFINEPERAGRCADAPEGHYAATHADIIHDWRDAFNAWIADRARGSWGNRGDRFGDAVRSHFDSVELWHDFAGSLNQEIG